MSAGLRFISKIIRDNSVSDIFSVEDSYFLPEEIPIFEFIKNYHEEYKILPSLATVNSECSVNLPPVQEPIEYYFKEVNNRRMYNEAIPKVRDIQNSLRRKDFDAVKNDVAVIQDIINYNYRSGGISTLGQAMTRVLEGYEEDFWKFEDIYGIPSGLPFLDEMTGGYQDTDVVSWVARPGMGKTFLLLFQALYASLLGHKVFVNSLEMPEQAIATRIIAMTSGIDSLFIKKRKLSTRGFQKLKETIEQFKDNNSFCIASGKMGMSTTTLQANIEEYNPSIIFIDGMYLLQPKDRRLTKSDKAQEVIREVKSLALNYRKPIIGMTQLNRSSGKYGAGASLETIAYTDAISTDSSLVLSIGAPDGPEHEDRRIISVLKGREGEKGTYHINYKISPCDFSLIEDPIENVGSQDL